MSKRRRDHEIGDEPVQPDLHAVMSGIARGLDAVFNGEDAEPEDRVNGFVLMVFPFNGHEGRCNYISNARREDIVIMMKQQLARFEGQADIVGHA